MDQGYESLLTLAAELRQTAPNVRAFFSHGLGSELMERAAEVIERLAHLEPDADVIRGQE